MKPVFQTICDREKGDCLRACVASLLELEIEQVPHFIRYKNWHAALHYFLAGFGIQFNGMRDLHKGRIPELEDTITGLYIAQVPSLNYKGGTHVVLMNNEGYVVHDPSLKLKYSQDRNLIHTKILKSWYLLQENVDTPSIPAEKLKIGDVHQITK